MLTNENEDTHHEKVDRSLEGMFEDDSKKLRNSTVLPNISMSNIGEVYRAEQSPSNAKMSPISSSVGSSILENKPMIRMEVSLSVNQMTIAEIFTRLCTKKGYEIIDSEKDQITAVKKRNLTLKDCILYCLPWRRRNQKLFNCVRMNIKTNKLTCKRKIIVKGLFGDTKTLKIFLSQVKAEMEYFNVKKSPSFKSSRSFFNEVNSNGMLSTTNASKRSRYSLIVREDNNSDNEDNEISNSNLESYSFYEFHKILSSDQYSLGKKVSAFIIDFMSAYKSIQESAELLPQPMEGVYLIINEIVDALFCDFNYGKSETKKMMPFCRISVEKFIFDKINAHLFEIYKYRYKSISDAYIKQCEDILHFYEENPARIFKYLDVNKKFWMMDAKYLNDKAEWNIDIEAMPKPYNDSILELNKLNKLKTPREKLSVLLMMHSLMKSNVVDYHKGKEELCSMDDELPIIIYIVLNAKIKDIEAEFAYIEDFINLDQSLESEKRLMTNLRVSVQYIVKEWKIE